MSSKNEWGELQDLLLALNIAAYPKHITYHYSVTSKFYAKRQSWTRLIKITKFSVENNKYKILDQKIPKDVIDGIKYAVRELKEIQS